jgi:hypothetical protein
VNMSYIRGIYCLFLKNGVFLKTVLVPFLLNTETKFVWNGSRMHSSHDFLVISALYCITYPKRRGGGNNRTLCIYENVCVYNFKYHVSVLFIQIFFIPFSKNFLHLVDTRPVTVPHGDK